MCDFLSLSLTYIAVDNTELQLQLIDSKSQTDVHLHYLMEYFLHHHTEKPFSDGISEIYLYFS